MGELLSLNCGVPTCAGISQGGPGGSGAGYGNFDIIGPLTIDQTERNTTWVSIVACSTRTGRRVVLVFVGAQSFTRSFNLKSICIIFALNISGKESDNIILRND